MCPGEKKKLLYRSWARRETELSIVGQEFNEFVISWRIKEEIKLRIKTQNRENSSLKGENYAKMRNVKSCFPVKLGSMRQRKSFMFGKHNDPIHNTVAVEKNYCIVVIWWRTLKLRSKDENREHF